MYALQNTARRAPQTEMESRIQAMWSEVLHISPEHIGCDMTGLAKGLLGGPQREQSKRLMTVSQRFFACAQACSYNGHGTKKKRIWLSTM